jgi:peroxiredoxin-like protein
MEDKYFYSTDVEWTGARHGSLRSDSLPTLQVDAPPEFKGQEGAWTPEHLFVGAVGSCFMTTFVAIAENSKLDFENFKVNAKGTLEKVEGRGLVITQIILSPTVTIKDAAAFARASRILEKAEQHCLISNSARTQIRLEPEIKVLAPAA